MKFLIVLCALFSLPEAHAQATGRVVSQAAFSGTMLASTQTATATATACSVTSTEYFSFKLKALVQSAMVEGMSFNLSPRVAGDCRTMVSNPYPEGFYGSTLLLKVNFARDCQTVLSYEFQSGLKMGKTQGYSCVQMRLVP